MLAAYPQPLPQPSRHARKRLHAHEQQLIMLARGRSTEISPVALARRASDERRKQMSLQVHAYDPPSSKDTRPSSQNSSRTVTLRPRDSIIAKAAGPSRALASSPPSTSATTFSSPSTCSTPLEPCTPPDHDSPCDHINPYHTVQGDTRTVYIVSDPRRASGSKGKSRDLSLSPSPSLSRSPSPSPPRYHPVAPPPTPSPEEVKARELRLRADAKRKQVLANAERVWEEILTTSRRDKAKIIMERARLEEERKEREHMLKEAERIDQDRQRRAHAYGGQCWARLNLRSHPIPPRTKPKDESFTYAFPKPKTSMTAPTASVSNSVSALARPTPASTSKTRRQLAALLAPPSHAPSSNPRIIPFKVVLSSMNGPLFPPSETESPPDQESQRRSWSGGSRNSIDSDDRRQRDELLSDLLDPVKWDQDRWPFQGRCEAIRPSRPARRDSCKACMAASSSSFRSATSASVPMESMASTSSSSFASSWLSFGSRKSISTARTTPAPSPVFGSSFLSIASASSKKLREPPDTLPLHSCRTPIQPRVTVDLYHSPLAPPPEPASSRTPAKNRTTKPDDRSAALTSRMIGPRRKALRSVTKITENLRYSINTMLSLATLVQEAYVAATVLGVQAHMSGFDMDEDLSDLSGDEEELEVQWTVETGKGKNSLGGKRDGWRVAPCDVAVFIPRTSRRSSGGEGQDAGPTPPNSNPSATPYVVFPLVPMHSRSGSESRSPSRSPSPSRSSRSSYSFSHNRSRSTYAPPSTASSYAHSYAAFAATDMKLGRELEDGMYPIPAAFPAEEDPFDTSYGSGYNYLNPRVGCRTRHVANPAALRVRAASNVWFRREQEKEKAKENDTETKPSNTVSSTQLSSSRANVFDEKDLSAKGILVRPDAMGSGKERVVGLAFDVFAKSGVGMSGSKCGRESTLRWGWRVVWGEEDDY